jgi:hypothetical protein
LLAPALSNDGIDFSYAGSGSNVSNGISTYWQTGAAFRPFAGAAKEWGRQGCLGRPVKGKNCFFEKKKQETFATFSWICRQITPGKRRFLVLFFRRGNGFFLRASFTATPHPAP